MTTIAPKAEPRSAAIQAPLAAPHTPSLRVSAYDQAASLLLALLALVGLVVFVLFVAWISSAIHVSQRAVPVTLEEVGGGQESGVGDAGMELDAPDMAEVAKEADLPQPELSETLAAVMEAAASIRADLDSAQLVDPLQQAGGGKSRGTGNQVAKGSGGGAGGGSGSGVGVPRGQRWEIRFSGNTTAEYARQLDFFKVELAVLGSGNEVYYAYNFSKRKPDQRVGPRDQEKRLYMSWRRGTLEKTDRELLKAAGIDSEGKIVLQFYPPEVEAQLAQLERDYRKREPRDIRQTRFAVVTKGRGFEFQVMDQSVF